MAIQYGAFINTIIQFLIVAFAVFMMVKLVNSLRRQDAAEPGPEVVPAPTPTEALLVEIRDALRASAPKAVKPAVEKAVAKPAAAKKPAAKKPAAKKG